MEICIPQVKSSHAQPEFFRDTDLLKVNKNAEEQIGGDTDYSNIESS